MENKTEKFIAENDLNEVRTLNLLQEYGIISDNCVRASDIADINFPAVEQFLLEKIF